ncbi:MAG: ASCH domain-containing protein [Dethiobacteria bacterium]|nr:ASCH domain-containing protein [Dethiobacteria bacterium]
MSKDPTVESMWQLFLATKAGKALFRQATYSVWHFGATSEVADKLALLVLEDKKKATSSAFWLYEYENEAVPAKGDFSVITDWAGKAKCIIRNTNVSLLPFADITAEMAAKEGEGDLSLDYWKKVHIEFFTKECEDAGDKFTEDMLVVFEEFELVYPVQK